MTQWNFSFMVVVFPAHVVINLRHNFFLKTCWRESKREIFSVPSCTCSQWGTVIEQTATVSVFPTKSGGEKKRHTRWFSSEYIKALAYKLAHCPSTSHERTEEAGCTNCSLLVQLTSCPTMSLIKAKQSRSQRSVSDKNRWAPESRRGLSGQRKNADTEGHCCSSLLQPLPAVRSSLAVTRGNGNDFFLEGNPLRPEVREKGHQSALCCLEKH